jgi:hypothetical protein
MTLSIQPNESNANSQQPSLSKQQPLNVEVIKALTPIVLALIGGIIGLVAVFTKTGDAGFGLASTAIAGAAGLAQPYKEPDKKDN